MKLVYSKGGIKTGGFFPTVKQTYGNTGLSCFDRKDGRSIPCIIEIYESR